MSISAIGIAKAFQQGEKTIEVLKGLDLEIKSGESLAIIGESGSGKSTLLSLLAGLERPDVGKIIVDGSAINEMLESAVTQFRGSNIGIVFQQFHLMPHLTALENVAIPLIIAADPDWRDKSAELLTAMQLSHRFNHFPAQLSGGECQRVAISRALANHPKLLLADEPTGNLDTRTAENVMGRFFEIVKEKNVTVLLVTHNEKLAAGCDRHAELKEGRLWF